MEERDKQLQLKEYVPTVTTLVLVLAGVLLCCMFVLSTAVMTTAFLVTNLGAAGITPVEAGATMPEQETVAAVVENTNTPFEEMALPTETPEPPTPTPELPTATPTETLTPTMAPPTATATIDTTAQASRMAQVVNDIFNKGVISSSEGEYTRLPDYRGSWAKPNEYSVKRTEFNSSNFVIRTDAAWQVYNNSGNWVESGCGIVVFEKDSPAYYLIYYSLDGRARLYRVVGGGATLLGRSTIYSVDRTYGQGELVVAVENQQITIYFNEKEIFRKQIGFPLEGVGFTIVSGLTSDYGTLCDMTNIDLWQIKQ